MSSKQSKLIRTLCMQCCMEHPVICEKDFGAFTKVRSDTDHPYAGHLCEKGLAAPELVYHPDRLNYPLKRTNPKDSPDPGWVRISWDEALDTVAKRLSEIKKKYGAESILLLAGAPGGGGYIDNLGICHRFGNCLGTPNRVETGIASCEFCRDTLAAHTFGYAFEPPPGSNFYGVQSQVGIENSACIMAFGYNCYETENENYYRMMEVRKRLGTKIIAVDPRRTKFAEDADLHLMLRPGTDGAIAMAIINIMLSRGLYDTVFVRDWTNAPFLVKTDGLGILTEKDISARGSRDKVRHMGRSDQEARHLRPENSKL